MAKLIAKSASDGLLPVRIGALTLSEAAAASITAIAPYPGKTAAAATALKSIRLDWPAPDRAAISGKAACLWSGRDQAFLVNAAPDALSEIAALTDITDGWAGLALDGAGAAEALARLIPLDLGPGAFPVGATARSGLGHMMVLIHRSGPQTFTLWVFRSMVRTAVHEIETAMKSLAARATA